MRFPFPSILLGCLAASAAASSAWAGEVWVTVRGVVVDDQVVSGPYLAPQVGDAATVRFQVHLPGTSVVPDHSWRYFVDPTTFSIDIAGPLPGAPNASAYLEVKDDFPGFDSLRYSHPLDNGAFLEFELTSGSDLFDTIHIAQLPGRYPVLDPTFPNMFQITDSGGPLRMDLTEIVIGDEPTFQNFCTPNANSTGVACTLTADWQPLVGSGLHLGAVDGPPGQFGYFLVGQAPATTPIALSQGLLCLSPYAPNALGRYNTFVLGRQSTGQFNAQGELVNVAGTAVTGLGFDVPFALPFPGAPDLHVGETWHFQLWYREVGIGFSNFSDALSVQF